MSLDYAKRVLAGDRRALARLITLVESRATDVPSVMAEIYPATGRAVILGFTGPPGAGKSTLVDKVTAHFRARDMTVAVVAVDPSSPFTGGALLGDRIRMHRHFGDAGVFIRSLGSRGSHGGVSRATRDVVRLMDAAGFDVVIVETVGVGQTELDIMEIARTTTVVLVPESGDVVQTMKAGLTEIADIFVVNKSDRAGADAIFRELSQMIELNDPSAWRVPVLQTQALKNIGVDELCAKIEAHGECLASPDAPVRRVKLTPERELVEVLASQLEAGVIRLDDKDNDAARLVRDVAEGRENPYAAAARIAKSPDLLRELLTA
ncbi:methylmalonyl Co-A mutase-associated GTPase MeaB [bacterium]|nr:methylmalonyl Co-A mutase-associated GTPase MeaB [bacterium]